MLTPTLALLALAAPAHATDQGDIAVSVGTAALTSETASLGLAGAGFVGFGLSDRVALHVGGREGVATGDTRVVGSVQVDVAWELSEHWFVRGGFVHHHETPWEAWLDAPAASLLGAGEGIRHRSGGDLGLGYTWQLPAVSTAGVQYSVWLSATAFPDALGPHLYGVLEHQFTLDFGKREPAAG